MDEKLKSENFNKLVLKKENLGLLEHLIYENSELLKSLNKKKLDYGPILKNREIKKVFEEVKVFIEQFLDVKVEDPDYNYFNFLSDQNLSSKPLILYSVAAATIPAVIFGSVAFGVFSVIMGVVGYKRQKDMEKPTYFPAHKRIVCTKEPKRSFTSILAHEQTHHIQNTLYKWGDEYTAFKEGHARGVQRATSYHFKEKYDNEAYLTLTTDFDLGELINTYEWSCKHLDVLPKGSIDKVKSSRDFAELSFRCSSGSPSPHAIGNSILLMEEAKHGKGIYKKLIHNDTSFLETF